MPTVAKCPNCNAPLDHAPAGPEQKCPYCGATLLATRYMPSPGAPGPLPGPYVPPAAGAPYPPASSGGWGTPAVGAPGGYPGAPPPFVPPPTLPTLATAAKRSSIAYIISSVVTLVIIGGSVAAVFFIQKEVGDRTQQALSTANQAIADRNAPIKLPPRPLPPGQELTIDLPSSTAGAGGRIVATLTVTLQEETPFEISLLGSEPFVSCRIKALDAADKALARSGDEGDQAQIYPNLPQGESRIIVDCAPHPAERAVRVTARPVPLLLPGQQVQATIEAGMESVGVIAVPDAAGPYAITLLCDDSSTKLQVLAADNLLVGKADVDPSTERAVLETSLQVDGYLAQAVRSFGASEKIPVTVALTSLAPEPLALGTPVTGTLTRYVPRRYYSFRLGAEGKIAVTLSSAAFDHTVEIQRADGVPVAASDEADTRERARVAPNLPLAAGEYRIVVRGAERSVSEGEFTVQVDGVTDAPPAPPAGRGGRRGTR